MRAVLGVGLKTRRIATTKGFSWPLVCIKGRKNFENVWGFGLQQQKNGQTIVSIHLLSILSKLKPNLFTKNIVNL